MSAPVPCSQHAASPSSARLPHPTPRDLGGQASLTEHQKFEVPLGGARLVLRPAGVEAGIPRLDPGKVEGLGLVQEAAAAPLHPGDLGRGVRGSWGAEFGHPLSLAIRKLRPKELVGDKDLGLLTPRIGPCPLHHAAPQA